MRGESDQAGYVTDYVTGYVYSYMDLPGCQAVVDVISVHTLIGIDFRCLDAISELVDGTPGSAYSFALKRARPTPPLTMGLSTAAPKETVAGCNN
jgi:hypothetical protein